MDLLAYSPVYVSKSKQLYSFSKSERFKKLILKNKCEKYYDPPSTKSTRSTSFGYGSRTRFDKRDKSPCPGRYELQSDFDSATKKGKVYTFGTCREAYKKVYIKAHPVKDLDIPGPGTYDVRASPGKEAKKYTMRPRTAGNRDGTKTPGPGTYNMIQGTSAKGNQFLSNFSSSRASVFNPRRSSRFLEIAKEIRGKPGPGQYPIANTISQKGDYFNSKFKSSQCRVFGSEKREFQLKIRPGTPGPGSYGTVSNFHSSPRRGTEVSLEKLIILSSKNSPKLKRTRSLGLLSTASTSRQTPAKLSRSSTKKQLIILNQ